MSFGRSRSPFQSSSPGWHPRGAGTPALRDLTGHAKNRDPAMGTTPAMKHVRRTTQGGGY
jgi:hypothetical protein